MKTNACRALLVIMLLATSAPLRAQTFSGTNAPGVGTNYSFTLGPAATNLSLVISNSSTAYSYLLLAKGRTPTDTDFDFISRLKGATNQINLQGPEFVATNYGLRVLTPATSLAHAFRVNLTTNRTDLRQPAYPVWKPQTFTMTGVITNAAGVGAFHYFQVDVPTNIPGWRVVLSTTNANADLYVQRGAVPTTGIFLRASTGQPIDTAVLNDTEATNSTYFIGVYLPAGVATNSQYTLTTEIGWLNTLTWDPGTADLGTQVYTNSSASGGDYYFKITTQNTANGAWRTALRVTGGEADVYLRFGALAQTNTYNYLSTRVGSDGFVLPQVAQWTPGQDWYFVVHATPGAQWTLMTGEPYVQQLPPLAADASSGTNGIIGPEGMRYFKTTISAGTLAWRLNLNGGNNTILVDNSRAPVLYSSAGSGYYDWSGDGQLLLVPNYINVGNQYIVGVIGNPGQNISLDSRQQAVTDLAFNSSTNLSATTYGYVTFRVQVPVQQIAWQLNLSPTSGNPNIAVRQDNVPNEYTNDAFSEVSGLIGDSITMVPPILSDGTFYVTVYGAPPFSCSLTNGQPIITDVSYVFQITNDAPARAGWRFYRVANTAQQLGTYGWDLALANQLPGTEIALRRNAVPSRWSFRNCTANCNNSVARSYLDYSGTAGFLQRPGHQADIWYIGVYQPTNALGSFVLSGAELTATPLSFDGGGSSQTIVNQPLGKWQYFVFNVPATNMLGWDLRLTNVTSGDPRLVICRDRLPYDINTHYYNGSYWYSYIDTTWPSGNSWGAADDWTGYYYNPGTIPNYGRILAMGRGNPLESGTYYVGVNTGSGTSPLGYTLVSRGIGTNLSLPVVNVPFSGGVAWTNNLPAREAAYYRVQISSNTPSWKLRLAVTNGEAMLLIQKDCLPNVVGGSGAATSLAGGRKLQKLGDEHYLLLPDNTAQTNIPPGTYYLAVVSEGQNPFSSTIGTGGCGYVLTSLGVQPTNQIGNLTAVGPDISTSDTLLGGEVKHYQFTVSPGVLAMEVRLDNRTANPRMTLRADGLLVQSSTGYGRDAGVSYSWLDNNLINIATPKPGTYTLAVQAETFGSTYSNASYTVVVHALTASPVVFDGGTTTQAFHSNGVWRYFEFNVPSNTFGWDLRLTNTTGEPRLVVCRDLAPLDLSTRFYNGSYWYSYLSTTWPSSNQWAAYTDWSGRPYDANGTNRLGHILQMGMGNPLEPGHYYVGVFSATPSTIGHMNYTLVSRGIGTNQSIPILNLPFIGSVSGTNIPSREAVYYKVQVPAGAASWKLRLEPTNSETLMLIQKDYLPNVIGAGSTPVQVAGGRLLQKGGVEIFTQLPRSSPFETTITNGTYYIAVVSEGRNPINASYTGTNSSSYTLYSYGPVTTNQLGTVDPSGTTDIIYNDSVEGSDFKFYQFSVPPGTLSLEVHLDNRVANPYMTLRADGDLPRPIDGFSFSDGHNYSWGDDTLINLTSPTPTNYTLCVQARTFVSGYSNASYTIRLHALGLIPVAFDGGTNRITNQPAGTWQYFTITVPPNAFGWDLRLTNVTSGNPQLVVRRDTLPDGLSTHTDTGGYWYSYLSTSWPTGYQWSAYTDWTGYSYDAKGSNILGKILASGMGNPLSPGNYVVGVINSGNAAPMTYTLVSRGIGTNFSIPILDLPFSGSVSTNGLLAGEVAYYKVTVPPNQRNWKLRLAPTSGEAMLMLQKDYLPNVIAGGSPPTTVSGGRALQKAGNEQYLLLPNAGQAVIPGGTYYVAVASEGVNPRSGFYGSNSCNFTLTSYGQLSYTNLGNVNPVDTVRSNSLQAGEISVYQFTVTNSPALEVRLDNKIGNSQMRLVINSNAPNGYYSYGYNNGENPSWIHDRIITLPNVAAGFYSLNVQADSATDVSQTLVIRQLAAQDLAFDRTLSTPSLTNVLTGALADLQHAYFKVTVPATFNGQPVLGWKLTLEHTQGNPRLRTRKDTVPDDGYNIGNSPWNLEQMAIVPPYLTPGTWYVDVQGQGTSQYKLTSSALLLERPAWGMPAIGGSVVTPGLPAGGPLFGDTGIATNGVALPADQGIDLEQGRFHYYAIVVPSNNVGVLRTRLDAISGNPDLYIRVGGAPTLSHYGNGDYYYSGILYERSLTANAGSEYGNWVPVDGRDELQLTPGIWYLAVQAGGTSNVRYRLQSSVGIVTDLNGLALVNQTLAAGDWRYYRVLVPTNSFTSWNVTFAQTLGDVIMYVRDTTPPGQGTDATDYRHWAPDNKNHGPYPIVDSPGTTNLPCPPLRPGKYHYLGFRAVNDATFNVSSTTNTSTIDYTNVVAFYGGSVTNVIPANGVLKYRVDVPGDARRWIHTSTHSNTVDLYLEQGAPPRPPSGYHWYSGTAANSTLNQQLYNVAWPWRPGYMYFLLVTNTTAISQNFVFNMNGQNSATDDFDGDGLPDSWELTYWPSIYSYNGNSDPDGDGVNNVEEYPEATIPTNNASFNPRLLVNFNNGIVTRNPVGNTTLTPPKVWYAPNTSVQLTATPNPGYSFISWTSDASGSANPFNVVMTTNKIVTAVFGITNNSGADYQFQLNLNSSVGSPPALQDIGVGNFYAGDTVDGCLRPVRQFPLHNGLRLQPTAGVIPTNVYTIAMLFRLDQTNGYRRLLDFKAGSPDVGLYVLNGRLYFYPAAQAATANIPANEYVQVVVTRDGTNLVGYVNGVQQFNFVDSSGYGVLTSANDLRFFKDDGTTEESGGAVARIRLYAAAMPAGQVALLDRVDCGCAPPQFLPLTTYSNGVVRLTLQITPNVSYAIQASTNLVNWVTITNVTSALPQVTITDSQAGNYSRRFYRGLADCGGGAATLPTATTMTASSLQISNATLNASINPGGAATTYYFQYGLTTAYGKFSLTNILPAGVSAVPTNSAINGLLPGTTYHYRVMATNSVGVGTGADMTFTTIAWPVITATTLQPGPSLSLQFSGTPNVSYTLEMSTNLINWTVRSNCVMQPSGLFQFIEPGVTNPPVRFYRLRWP